MVDFKPMLACNGDLSKIKDHESYIVQPKIDGVRGLVIDGHLVGRSLKPFKNQFLTRTLSKPEFSGLDFEITVGHKLISPTLCSDTTSFVNTIDDIQPFSITIFDDFTYADRSYHARLTRTQYRIDDIERYLSNMSSDDQMVKIHSLYQTSKESLANKDSIDRQIEHWAETGYEGSVLRSIDGRYKYGRATLREGTFLKFKSYIDFNFIITSGEEMMHNKNEATTNALGYTERSTHQENMVPSGMIGAIWGILDEDVNIGGVTLKKGDTIKVGAGKMSHEDRRLFFTNPEKFVGQYAVGQTFAYGAKEKLRHPTFQHLRSKEDVSY